MEEDEVFFITLCPIDLKKQHISLAEMLYIMMVKKGLKVFCFGLFSYGWLA